MAQLNLDRSEVRASVDGMVTNFSMRPGDYVTAGAPIFALIDSDSIYVEGYFEETKLPQIQAGDRARVRLMGESQLIEGHVQSIAGGIADRERQASNDLLANIAPTFSWVRLAQRVPVRIALDHVPPGVRLLVGPHRERRRAPRREADQGDVAGCGKALIPWLAAARE